MGALNPKDLAKEHKGVLLPVIGLILMVVVAGYVLDSEGGYLEFGENLTNDLPGAGGDSDPVRSYDSYPDMILEDGVDYFAKIETNYGEIEIDLYEDLAPLTVNSFVFLSNNDYYDNLTFHRLIAGALIQGGDPDGDGTGGPGYTYEDEVDNNLVFGPGLIAMANTGQPVSNGSQFFITTSDSELSYLNGKHTIFGEITEGLDVVDEIASQPIYQNSQPKSVVRIREISIIEEKS